MNTGSQSRVLKLDTTQQIHHRQKSSVEESENGILGHIFLLRVALVLKGQHLCSAKTSVKYFSLLEILFPFFIKSQNLKPPSHATREERCETVDGSSSEG